MRLYIFRHGQTDANVNEIVQGVANDYSINAVGLIQAEKLRDELAAEKLPIIYTSPLSRAQKTAQVVAEPNNSQIVILDELHEHNFGDAEGLFGAGAMQKYAKEFRAILDVTDLDTYNEKIPNGESKQESLERFKEALDFIAEDCQCEKAGVATHGHIMRIFYNDYFGKDVVFPNCGYFILDI